MSRGCVLAVFAHPDDESLVAGGTLAALAAAGWEVVVLSLTRGEQGPIAHADLATPANLGQVRAAELRAAAEVLALTAAECLDYPDGELRWADPARMRDDVARVIRRWQSIAVVTFGPEGLYWHRDHVAVHQATTAAVDLLAGEGLEPWLYYATWPEGWMTQLAAALGALGSPVNLWGLQPDDFGARVASITTTLDVRPYLDAKLRAIRSHRTQLDADHLFSGITDALALEFFGCEWFVRARPSEASEDWLERAVGCPMTVANGPETPLR